MANSLVPDSDGTEQLDCLPVLHYMAFNEIPRGSDKEQLSSSTPLSLLERVPSESARRGLSPTPIRAPKRSPPSAPKKRDLPDFGHCLSAAAVQNDDVVETANFILDCVEGNSDAATEFVQQVLVVLRTPVLVSLDEAGLPGLNPKKLVFDQSSKEELVPRSDDFRPT